MYSFLLFRNVSGPIWQSDDITVFELPLSQFNGSTEARLSGRSTYLFGGQPSGYKQLSRVILTERGQLKNCLILGL